MFRRFLHQVLGGETPGDQCDAKQRRTRYNMSMVSKEFEELPQQDPKAAKSGLVPGQEPPDQECAGQTPTAKPPLETPRNPTDIPYDEIDDGGWLCI
jgi:hypothetical protein